MSALTGVLDEAQTLADQLKAKLHEGLLTAKAEGKPSSARVLENWLADVDNLTSRISNHRNAIRS